MPVIKTKDLSSGVIASIKALTKQEVLVGIPAEAAGRPASPDEKKPIDNATIGYINEFGSTIAGANGAEIVIPPRPHLRPGIASVKDKLSQVLKAGVTGILHGKVDAGEIALEKAGLIGQSGVRAYIRDGDLKPLAPSTLANRRRHGRAGVQPLIDTGTYRRAITYVVRKRGDD